MVGATGFEPAASWSRTKHATKLRYAPKSIFYKAFFIIYFSSIKVNTITINCEISTKKKDI